MQQKMKLLKQWKFDIWIFLFVVIVSANSKRHVLYWDAESSHEYLNVETGRVLNVKIGQFMDILCPQTSLINQRGDLKQPIIFDLFNVTKPFYDQCGHEGRQNFIFSCNKPERENKLTIKFQLISPSPLGFRFQYCKDYYFVAVPRDKDKWVDGCQSNSSTRLHIKVACRRGAHHHTTTKRTPSVSPRLPSLPPKPNIFDSELDKRRDVIFHPSVVPHSAQKVSPKTRDVDAIRPKVNVLAQTANKNSNSENSVSNLKPALSLTLMMSLLYIILTSFT